jgi:hypothetical protein
MSVRNMGGRCPFEIWEEDARSKHEKEYAFIRGKGNARSKYGSECPFIRGERVPVRDMRRQRRIYKRTRRVFHGRAEEYFMREQRSIS